MLISIAQSTLIFRVETMLKEEIQHIALHGKDWFSAILKTQIQEQFPGRLDFAVSLLTQFI